MSSLIEPSGPGLTAFIEERLLVPALSMPFQLQGPARRCTARFEGEELRIVAIGRFKRFRSMFRRLFDDVGQIELTTTRTIWQPQWLDDLDADLIVADVHRWVADRFRQAGWMIMPDSVRWSGDPAVLPPPAPCHSLQEDLKKIERCRFTLEQVTGWREWNEFHRTMLIPQALSRLGEGAWLPTRRFLKELAGKGVLHILSRKGERIAGIVTVRHGDTLWLPVSGVRGGTQVLLRQGATVALYARIFEWARAEGCRWVDAGRTSAFINEGLHRNKHEWGLQPLRDPLAHLLAMRIGSVPALRRAFAAQPVLMETRMGLEPYAGGPG